MIAAQTHTPSAQLATGTRHRREPLLPSTWLPATEASSATAPPLTAEQRDFVARYWLFSTRTGRKCWRASMPRTLREFAEMGSPEDGEGIGIDALLETAIRYPLPCGFCRGKQTVTCLRTGLTKTCPDCEGTGQPRNQHKAIHTYLRLAILTQVRNEVNKRAAACRQTIGVRRQLGTGCMRRGRVTAGMGKFGEDVWVPMRDGEELAGLTVPFRVRTGRAVLTGEQAQAGQVAAYVGLGTPYYPSADLRARFNARSLEHASQVVWDEYVAEYKRTLRRVLVSPAGREFWTNVLRTTQAGGHMDLTLTCDCVRADRCHRVVLAEVLAVATGGIYEGEV